jgi:hypothetical protein
VVTCVAICYSAIWLPSIEHGLTYNYSDVTSIAIDTAIIAVFNPDNSATAIENRLAMSAAGLE